MISGDWTHRLWLGFRSDPNSSMLASKYKSLHFQAQVAKSSPCSEPSSSREGTCNTLAMCYLVGQKHSYQTGPPTWYLPNAGLWKCHQKLCFLTTPRISIWCCGSTLRYHQRLRRRLDSAFPSAQARQIAHPTSHSPRGEEFPSQSRSPCNWSLVT